MIVLPTWLYKDGMQVIAKDESQLRNYLAIGWSDSPARPFQLPKGEVEVPFEGGVFIPKTHQECRIECSSSDDDEIPFEGGTFIPNKPVLPKPILKRGRPPKQSIESVVEKMINAHRP